MEFVKSEKIEVFPSGFRDPQFIKAKLTSEENLTAFVSNFPNRLNNEIYIEESDGGVIIGIDGYVFKLLKSDIPSGALYAGIKLRAEANDNTALPYGAVLANLHTSSNSVLDTPNDNESEADLYFRGLGFSNNTSGFDKYVSLGSPTEPVFQINNNKLTITYYE